MRKQNNYNHYSNSKMTKQERFELMLANWRDQSNERLKDAHKRNARLTPDTTYISKQMAI